MEGQRTKQHSVNDAEDRRVSAGRNGQREYRHGGQPGLAAEGSESVDDVVPHRSRWDGSFDCIKGQERQ